MYKSENIYEELEREESSLVKKFATFTQMSFRCISTSDQYKIFKEKNYESDFDKMTKLIEKK